MCIKANVNFISIINDFLQVSPFCQFQTPFAVCTTQNLMSIDKLQAIQYI